MNDKIKAIIEAKGLTPSRFADEIGVPRPIVSHILAGRNKPSLDMVQKIIRRFPELGTEWILDENALPNGVVEVKSGINVMKAAPAEPRRITAPPDAPSQPPATPMFTESIEPPPTEPPKPAEVPPPTAKTQAAPEKNTKKVFVFYADKTFDEYSPNT